MFLLLIKILNSQFLLRVDKPNILENNSKYKCQLNLNEIKNSKDEINYIVFEFKKEAKIKRNEIYISKYKNETMNSRTIFKLALYGSNKIIVPFDYIKKEEYLYMQIKCYDDKICEEEILINLCNEIIIKEGETLYINGYKGNYIYDFTYKFNIKEKDNINEYRQITVNSFHQNDFEFEINNSKNDIKKIFNGYSYFIESEDYKNCKNDECLLDLKIKIIKPTAYIMIQIIKIDNKDGYNHVEIYRPITGLLDKHNDKRCFEIKEEKELEKKNSNLFIDFMIEDELQTIIYEDNNNNRINIFYSQTIKANNKFCIKKYYQNVENIFFYFNVYLSEAKRYIRNKSYLGLLYNGYYYRKITSEKGSAMEYYPSDYNDISLYFYINIRRGYVNVNHIKTNNFPFTKDKIEDSNYESLTINKIGNEFFGKILIREDNIMSSSPMNPNKNILSIDCESGVNLDENDDFCEFNIIFFTQNDVIHLRKNDKFSFLNIESWTNSQFYNIKLNIEIIIPLIISNNEFNYQLVIDTYSQLGSSYVDVDNNDNLFYAKNTKTFYNDNLVSKEIIFNYDKNNNEEILKYEKINYKFKIIIEDLDYISVIISGKDTNENDDKLVETRLWLGGYIPTTLTKRIPKKKIIIDNLAIYPAILNYFRTFIIFKYLNCDVKTRVIDVETKNELSNDKIQLKDRINNVDYMVISKYLNKEIKNYLFDIELDKIYDNEPVCMVYFSGFFIDDLSMSTQYPIFLKEDTETPVLFIEESPNGLNYEYLILNFFTQIIISVSFEQIGEISLTYSFDKNIINDKSLKRKKVIFHYSRSYIISDKEVRKNCLDDEKNYENNIYENKYICKLQIVINRKFKKNEKKAKFLLNLKVRMNNIKPVGYLNSNTLTNGLILSGQFRYYYSNIRQNDSGYIALNHKKGIGLMYARIINKNTHDDGIGEKWNGRIKLLLKDEINKCKDCLIYDINTNEIVFTEEHTKNCNSDLRCQIIIGVTNVEDIPYDVIEDNVYEYSIYLIKNNKEKKIYGNLLIKSNEYIQGTLYENNSLDKNKIIYNYLVPENVENIRYELQCKKCSFNLILDDNKIQQNRNKNNILKYNSEIVQFHNENQISSYYNKIIQFEISTDEYEQNNYSIIFFKISLLYKGQENNIILLNSESNTVCYKNCEYLIPIYDYDKLASLTMSVSDISLTANLKVKLEFFIYDSLEYYQNIMNNDKNIKYEKIESNKNYIIYKPKKENKFRNILIKAYINILNENAELNYYSIFFTYNKQSHKNYFLYPNRINLINIETNNANVNNITKEIKFPDYYLINNYQNKNKNDYSSIIKFKYIKGEGVVNLVTQNLYLSNNVYMPYIELKNFIFDYSHSFFQINYNHKSKMSKYIGIDTKNDLYLYGTITTNLRYNINEIKLGKSNYILYQYDSEPFILYIKINNINEIQNDISINIKLEGLEIYKKYEWYLTGYFIKTNNIKDIINIMDTKPVSLGYHDDITNIGIIRFNKNDMINYYNQNNNLVLLIKLIDIKAKKLKGAESIDIMVKAIPMPTDINPKNNNEIFSIPPFEYYFSYLNENYNSYKLSLFKHHNKMNYMSIELFFSSEKINYALIRDISSIKSYFNDTNIKIVDERFQNGKRSLILLLEKEIKDIYLIIFNKENNRNDNIFYSFKYYYLSKEEYEKGKYLYKNRFILNNNNIKLEKKDSGVYCINWEEIKLLELKEKKGKIKIDYYLKILNDNANSIGLFKNYDSKNIIYEYHLINKNQTELLDIHYLKDKNIIINLIARFNELNGMENYVIYEPLLLFNKNEDNKDNKNNKKSPVDTYEKSENLFIVFIKKIFYILLILVIISIIILFMYKVIRRYQINKIVNKLIVNNKNNSNMNYELHEDDYHSDSLDGANSKISYMIENL